MTPGAQRADIRADARAALALSARIGAMTSISAWFQVTDATPLPAYGVAVPSTSLNRTTHDGGQGDHQLVVVIKRAAMADLVEGLEDDLDADADAALAALVALRSRTQDIELTQIATVIDRTGGQPVGTLTLTFTVTTWA